MIFRFLIFKITGDYLSFGLLYLPTKLTLLYILPLELVDCFFLPPITPPQIQLIWKVSSAANLLEVELDMREDTRSVRVRD